MTTGYGYDASGHLYYDPYEVADEEADWYDAPEVRDEPEWNDFWYVSVQ